MPLQDFNVTALIEARHVAFDRRAAPEVPQQQPRRIIDYGRIYGHQIATASSLPLTRAA